MAMTQAARSARTRSALIAAGITLLQDRPIDAIPIDDLVRTAGVGKGSFFNHFSDKQEFASTLAECLRDDIEAMVTIANRDTDGPLSRLAGGMRVAASIAFHDRKRATVLLRAIELNVDPEHPQNEGVKREIDDAVNCGDARAEAAAAGVMFWVSLCHGLVAYIAKRGPTRADALDMLAATMKMGLRGLGTSDIRIGEILAAQAAALSHITTQLTELASTKPDSAGVQASRVRYSPRLGRKPR